MNDRSVIRHWVMRKTAHLFPSEDYGWLTPLFAERIGNWSRRRLGALGVEAGLRDRALAAIRRELESGGSMTRGQAMELAVRAGIDMNVQRRTHLSMLPVVDGWACIGPDAGRESMFVATREWIGEPRMRGREEALAELARRYVVAFAPVSDRDFSFWSGLPLRDCRAGLKAISGELREVPFDNGGVLVAPKGWSARLPASPAVRLLGAYDTYLMGYESRKHAVDSARQKQVMPGGGILRPTICVDGKFVGTWSSKKADAALRVTLEPFGRLDESWIPAIEAEAADIARFEGIPRAAVEV